MTWKQLVDKYVLDDETISPNTPVLAADIIIAYNAQGVVDNGGFAYFFEADFPGKTHHQVAESFRRLDLAEHANLIEKMMALFPEGTPHQDIYARIAFIAERFHWDRDEDRNSDVRNADNYFWDHSEEVYSQLDKLAESL